MDLTAPLAWLLLGAAVQLLGFGRWMTAAAAWVAPVFLLHGAHGLPPLAGFAGVWLALAAAFAISLRGIVPIPGLAYLVLPVLWGLTGALPYAVDRLAAPLVPGFATTLVFPLAWTAIEFLAARTNPYGSWSASAYTQHGVLPLMQLASVTGLWGIGFLIAWFAAVVNMAWDHGFAWSAAGHDVLAYGAVACAVGLFGGWRVACAPHRETVRVAGIGWPRGIVEQADFMRAVEPDLAAAERERLRGAFARLQDSFLARTEREARAGAKLVVWPEANLMVFDDDEGAFVERARTLARTHSIHLVMGLATLHPGQRHTFRNHALLLTPEGAVAYDYTKTTAVPGFEKRYGVPGKAPIPFADTAHGRVASPICFDLDFQAIVRQTGRARVDLMLVPASDWEAILPLHQQMAEFRAIENGAALLRITRWGASGAVDPYGRRLGWLDDFRAEDPVMVAQLPVRAGVRTPYARIGDAFGWLCAAALAACVALVVATAAP